jgi:hypothetical protein
MTYTASKCFEALCEVENVPEYAECYRYWIVTPVKGRLWFWGAYMHRNKAEFAVSDAGGNQIIVENEHAMENRKRIKEAAKNE